VAYLFGEIEGTSDAEESGNDRRQIRDSMFIMCSRGGVIYEFYG